MITLDHNRFNRHEQANFNGQSIINAVGNIEANILLNKGITYLGGFVIPQAIMSNNRDETIERTSRSFLWGAITFASPYILLPLFNRGAVKAFSKIGNFKGNNKYILEVSKKYLTKDGAYLEKGIKEKSKELFDNENGFNEILNTYQDKEKLRKDLINIHTAVLFTDFITTNLMVASLPWLMNMITKMRTNRSGFSATYKLADENFTKEQADKANKTKRYRQYATLVFALLPALIFPPLLKKGMSGINKDTNSIIKWFNKHADKFDYKDSKFMARLTAFIMWVSGMFLPIQLSFRDKYEQRDNIIRGSAIGLVFWGGDLFLKKAFAKISDKFFGTKLINSETGDPYYINQLKNYKNIDKMKNIPEKVMKRTQKAAVGLYILNLSIISATLGFGLPFLLNKLLKRGVTHEKISK